MADEVSTPYNSAKRLIAPGNMPTWLNDYDALRYASYGLYEDIYWTEPNTFKLTQRGNDENPLYIPTGRIICNTINRYTAKDYAFNVDIAFGTSAEQAALLVVMKDLFKRERLGTQHRTNKLYGVIRGDSMWHITGNPLKPEGSRVSVRPIDPRMVFPINPKEDVDRVIGYDIIEQTIEGDTTFVVRTRYLKPDHEDHPSFGTPGAPISVQKEWLEVENWETDPKVDRVILPVALMPPEITSLPIYHVKNLEEPGNPFGSSEMRGIERLMAGINQSMSDEELTLALHGLGMYKSNKGQPIDPVTKNPVPWQLGPGKVVHDDTFDRVQGVNTVTPFLDHVKYLEDRGSRVSGASDVAQGIVDVTVAESGIALALRMGPIVDHAGEKTAIHQEVYDNMLFDLRAWVSVYEGMSFGEARVVSSFGKALPRNEKERFNELFQMVSADPPLITMAYFRDAVREMGYDIPADVNGITIAEELAGMAEASDPQGARQDAELDNAGGDVPEEL